MSRPAQPPHDLEAERSVLGCCLLEPDVIDLVADRLRAEDFYAERHRVVYESLVALRARGDAIDQLTLRSTLNDAGNLRRAGGDEQLLSLMSQIPTVAHVEDHAERVRQRAAIRRMIDACQQSAAEGYAASSDPDSYLDRAEHRVFSAAHDRRSESGMQHVREIIHDVFQQLQRAQEQGRRIHGLPSGIVELDSKTTGLHPGQLIVVGARPGMGKSMFGGNLASANARNDRPAAVFSLEMGRDEWAKRILAAEAHIDGQRLRTADMRAADWDRVVDAAQDVSGWNLHIDDTPALTLLQIRSRCRRLQARHGLSLIVIDYLQLMRSGLKHDSREQEIAEISRGLKALAKELEVPVVALAQLNRGVEGRRDKRPVLADLRESGQVEQDSDVVMFLYRDELYDPKTNDLGIVEIIVAKQRSGPLGTVRCKYTAAWSRFDNLEVQRADETVRAEDYEEDERRFP